MNLFTYVPFYPCTFLLCTFLPMYLFIYVPMHLFTYVLFYLFTFVPMYLFTYLPLYLCIFLPMYLFIYVPNVCLSVHLFVRLCLYILHRSTSIFVFTSNPTLLRFNFLSFHFNWKVAPKKMEFRFEEVASPGKRKPSLYLWSHALSKCRYNQFREVPYVCNRVLVF